MKQIFCSIVIAFSMYSKVPMPRVDWKKENMRYVMCAFPWVGALIGALFILWGRYGDRLGIGHTLYTVILLLIPVVLTGGIHLDGFLDTSDALSSYQPMERRLEILKDSHAGAFAILMCAVYFLAYFGFLSELSKEYLGVMALGFFLIRCLSGLSVTTFVCAKNSGLAATFADSAHRSVTKKVLLLELILCGILMLVTDPVAGAVAIAVALSVFWYYHHMSMKQFGGITGDLAGWFLQVCELCMVMGLVVVQVLTRIL